jgi:predicted nucleic acid-binding Zn ribbon protein
MSEEEELPDAATVLFNRFRKAAEESGQQRLRRPPKNMSLNTDPRAASAAAQRETEGRPSRQQADLRDPKLLGEALQTLVRTRGWTAPVAVGSVISRWDQLVGEAIAQHCRPETFEDGVVTVSCNSTAWATNLKLMKPKIMDVFEHELGKGIVTDIDIRGPQAPSWKKGRYSVRGRGPRDTYG